MSGAEFQRHAGTDVQKWAEAFYEAYQRVQPLRTTRGERIDFVRAWFRDCAEVRVAEEGGARHRAPLGRGMTSEDFNDEHNTRNDEQHWMGREAMQDEDRVRRSGWNGKDVSFSLCQEVHSR